MNETIINGVHLAFALGGVIVGGAIGFFYGWMARDERDTEVA